MSDDLGAGDSARRLGSSPLGEDRELGMESSPLVDPLDEPIEWVMVGSDRHDDREFLAVVRWSLHGFHDQYRGPTSVLFSYSACCSGH